MEQIEKFLAELPLFKTFSPAQLKELIEQSQLRDYAPREAIIHFGQQGRFLGIIINGEAEAVITGEAGERQLGLLRRGNILGEMSLLTGEPTSADVIAMGKCQVLLIPQDVFSSSLAINPEAMKVMARILSERLRSRQQDEEAQVRVEQAWQSLPDPYGLQLSLLTCHENSPTAGETRKSKC